MKCSAFLFALVGLLLPAVTAARAQDPEPAIVRRTQPWDPEILELVETLPVQDAGRIKPLHSVARLRLLEFSGRSELSFKVGEDEDGEKIELSATEWLLDCLFFPDQARSHPCFLVQTWEVADAIGVPRGKKGKRDRWSYDELWPGRETLGRLADNLDNDPLKRDAKNRTLVEAQLMQLAEKIGKYEFLTHFLDFAHHPYPVSQAGNLPTLFGGATEIQLGTLLAKAPLLLEAIRQLKDESSGLDEARRKSELEGIFDLLSLAERMSARAAGLALLPPSGAEAKEWLTPADLFGLRFSSDMPLEPQLAALGSLEEAWTQRTDMAALRGPLQSFRDRVLAIAEPRGEYAKIGAEVAYHRADLFYVALILYILGFVAVAASWLVQPTRKFLRVLPWALSVPLLVHVVGIVWRCILRGRPPVSTLYETILFISGVAVLVALVIEFINRRRIGLALAPVLGSVGLFLAGRYEIKEAFDNATDTMPQLQAVLDTNFWLATHVTTVTIGYAAGLLAGFIAHVYIFARLFGGKRSSPEFLRSLARMTYGVVCFGLLFSVVGTILGGIWANDSWGRFWGWDPKENGALMICLAELTILHARMGGYIRDAGLATAAVFGNIIVAFSWWGVNLMGVGLHSYGDGFAHAVKLCLVSFYGLQVLVGLGGIYLCLLDRENRKRAAATT